MKKLLIAALPLLAPTLLAQGTPEGAEPNNTTTTAAVLATGAQGFGDITAGDEDWFKITLTSARDLKVWTGPGFAGQIGDTRVRIYAADGTTILIDMDDGNLTTHGYYTSFVVGNYAAGDYYVAVRGFGATTAGSYTLDVVSATPGTYSGGSTSPVTEGAEDNDPRNTNGVATLSMINSSNSGNIAAGASSTSYTVATADYDFYMIPLASPGVLTIATSGGPAPTATDTVVHLVDSTLTRLAFDDDSGPNAYSVLTYTITTPGLYYVAISDWSTGNYVMDVTYSPLLGIATTTIQTGGCTGSAGLVSLANRLSTSGTNVRPERLILGSEFVLDVTNVPANAPMFTLLGLATLPTPFDLTPLGAPGCLVEVDSIATSLAFATAAGVNFWGFLAPSTPSLSGLPIEQQVVVLDAAANALGVTASNRVSSVSGAAH